MSKTGPGTLKCIIGGGRLDAIRAAVSRHVNAEDIRGAGAGAVLVHTPLEASDLRDLLASAMGEGDSLLVVEFEKWSGFGAGIDRQWLLARGH